MKTAICIASGPSLAQEDVDFCRGKGRVYVVKECRHMAPWADVLYAADEDWWFKFEGCPDFQGERWTVSKKAADRFGLHYAEAKTQWHWSTTQGALATGGNSGFQAMNLAALQGAERIVLLGYDMGHAAGQNKHWWDEKHPRHSRESNYAGWLERMDRAAPFITVPVLNASRQSAIRCFEKVDLRGVL